MVLKTETLIINDKTLTVSELSAFMRWELEKTNDFSWNKILSLAVTPFDIEFFKGVGKDDYKKLLEAYARVNGVEEKSPSEKA
jgi:hypothetical protein